MLITEDILEEKVFQKDEKLIRNINGRITNFVIKDLNDKVLNLSSEDDTILWHCTTHLNISRDELSNGFWSV